MKKLIPALCAAVSLYTSLFSQTTSSSELPTLQITRENLASLPVPSDFKNYYILQSFEKLTNVIIADMSGAEKVFCLVTDKNSDGVIDEITEYYPDSKQYARPEKPTTPLYTGYPQIKRDIIEGKVFNTTGKTAGKEYTHIMASLPVLKQKINEGRSVSRRGADGRYVRLIDPDIKDSTMADFYFGKEIGLYNLQFKTLYYKSGAVKIEPLIIYSVYAKGSKDAVIAEYVEALLKLVKGRKL